MLFTSHWDLFIPIQTSLAFSELPQIMTYAWCSILFSTRSRFNPAPLQPSPTSTRPALTQSRFKPRKFNIGGDCSFPERRSEIQMFSGYICPLKWRSYVTRYKQIYITISTSNWSGVSNMFNFLPLFSNVQILAIVSFMLFDFFYYFIILFHQTFKSLVLLNWIYNKVSNNFMRTIRGHHFELIFWGKG